MAVFAGVLVGISVTAIVSLFISITNDKIHGNNRTKGICEKLRESADVDTDGIWHFNDALSEFKDEISELDRDIKYAEEMKRLEREKADKKSYLDSLYLEDEEKDAVYSVQEQSYGGVELIGVYATRTEAEDVKQIAREAERAYHVGIREHTINRPKKEDE